MGIIKVIYKNPQNISTEAKVFSSSSKLQEVFMESVASYDKVIGVSYLDLGLRNQRVDTIDCQSVLFPNSTMTKKVFYLDVGTMSQRIEKIEYDIPHLTPNNLRKIFDYTVVSGRYVLSEIYYEMFI